MVLKRPFKNAKLWCTEWDLNPHVFKTPPPQDGVSTNSTTGAIDIFLVSYISPLEALFDDVDF